MVVKMLNKLRRKMKEHSGNFNKELEDIRKNQDFFNLIFILSIYWRIADLRCCVSLKANAHKECFTLYSLLRVSPDRI